MSSDKLYMETYAYYRTLIEDGTLAPNDRMPSLRQCCLERGISKTTAETAYFQLIADGYLISRERSGYYVTNTGKQHANASESGGTSLERQDFEPHGRLVTTSDSSSSHGTNNSGSSSVNRRPSTKERFLDAGNEIQYDFSRVGDDASAFCFDLWQKYMKSAMRDTESLISYGEPQGEVELREELAGYVRKRRNIYCTADHIVIGASTQNLLMLLLAMLKMRGLHTASVPTISFTRYARAFSDYDFEVGYRNKDADVIYVSPSHMTAWGEVMTLKRRYELLEHSKKGHLVIEDDYLNDLNYSKQACPSIYALSGGENVVYMGSFSRVLLPSIRLSYMILSKELLPVYQELRSFYDQTASKTEQLSLCRFLRDQKLDRHVRRIRRLYDEKRDLLRKILERSCCGHTKALPLFGDSGTEAAVRVSNTSLETIQKKLNELHASCRIVREQDDQYLLIFSCGIIDLHTLETLYEQILVG